MHIANATVALTFSLSFSLSLAHSLRHTQTRKRIHARHEVNGTLENNRQYSIAHALHTTAHISLRYAYYTYYTYTCAYSVQMWVYVTRSSNTIAAISIAFFFFFFLTPWHVSFVHSALREMHRKCRKRERNREKGGRERLLQSSSKSVFIYGAVCSECLFIRAFIGDRLFSPAYFSLCRSFDRFARLERTVQLPGICSLRFCNGERRFAWCSIF